MFALTPRQANAIVPIDYTSTAGIKLFNIAIMKLPEIFDGDSEYVNMFNKKPSERSK